MKQIIYFLAIIGGLCVLCFVLFLAIGLINTIDYHRKGGNK